MAAGGVAQDDPHAPGSAQWPLWNVSDVLWWEGCTMACAKWFSLLETD